MQVQGMRGGMPVNVNVENLPINTVPLINRCALDVNVIAGGAGVQVVGWWWW